MRKRKMGDVIGDFINLAGVDVLIIVAVALILFFVFAIIFGK